MTGQIAAGAFLPRRPWLLWAIVAVALAWFIATTLQGLIGLPPAATTAAAVLARAMPPLLAALFAVGLLGRGGDGSDYDALRRLAGGQGPARAIDTTLEALEALEITLLRCLDRTADLAARGSDEGSGLAATAARLVAAAADVRQSGLDASGAADRVAASLPALDDVHHRIEGMAGRLGGDTVRQLELVEALLTAVRVRGDEVALQADAAIASLNKQLADVDEASRATTSRIAKRAYALDAAVEGAAARAAALLEGVGDDIGRRMVVLDDRLAAARAGLDAVGEHGTVVIGERLARVHDAGERLAGLIAAADEHSQRLRAGTDAHLAALPAQVETARIAGETALAALGDGLAALHTRAVALDAPLAGSAATLATLGDDMGRLERTAGHFGTTVATALPGAADGVARLETATAAVAERITALHGALASGEQAARDVAGVVAATRLDAATLGDADLRRIDDRMNATATVLADIGRQIAAFAALSGETRAAVAGDIAAVDRALRLAQDAGTVRLDALTAHVGVVRAAVDDLAGPVGRTRTLLGDVEAQVAQVGATAAGVGDQLDARLAAASDGFAHVHDRARGLLGEATALQAATDAGTAAIAAASGRFADGRAALTDAAGSLGSELDRAGAVLHALDAETGRVTAETVAALGATFERARTLAEANGAALREMLAGIVAEAGRALGETGAEVAETAFGSPIRRELSAIGEVADHAGAVAEAAARRVGGQARALGTTIDAVDARVAELETRLDVRSRDTLAARSARLVEMLGTASVDVARLLAVDAGEGAWVRYLKGDRSLFARRAVRLVDRDTSARIARHFAHDAAFRDEASHYLDLFERLSRRLLGDPDGETLLATMVSSDFGKLYVAIARATGRWSPVG